MIQKIVSIYGWIALFIVLIILFPPFLLIYIATYLFDPKLKVLHGMTTFWAFSFLSVHPYWRVKVENKENFESGKTYVMISNHQSFVDILLVYQINKYFKWVSKAENFKMPIVGWVMSMNRYISVHRESRKSILKMIEDCGKMIRKGASVMIFPEGTRSHSDQMRNFKEGAFQIALQQKAPILPIVLSGSARALPRKGWVFPKTNRMKMKVLPAWEYDTFAHLDAGELARKMREFMEKELQQLN
ncbi:MAG: 1-acylglycerol-3-phosphate O-acyltransferase [Bacteroidetes bacterium]|jgi:1-acyl-sn-glycerol-3-phosphate acyltransferase|nr:1-acylglycerol-3-phosphate O-acyltransferase [Bacteroidota bacterium]